MFWYLVTFRGFIKTYKLLFPSGILPFRDGLGAVLCFKLFKILNNLTISKNPTTEKVIRCLKLKGLIITDLKYNDPAFKININWLYISAIKNNQYLKHS